MLLLLFLLLLLLLILLLVCVSWKDRRVGLAFSRRFTDRLVASIVIVVECTSWRIRTWPIEFLLRWLCWGMVLDIVKFVGDLWMFELLVKYWLIGGEEALLKN